MKQRKIVAVVGSGNAHPTETLRRAAQSIGRWIARHDAHLLTGGGAGVMKEACRGFYSTRKRSGLSIGIIPRGRDPDQYPNRFVEVPIYTHLKGADPKGRDSRNHIIARTATFVIALSGHRGTQAEVEIALSLKKPVVVILLEGKNIGSLSENFFRRRRIPVFEDVAASLGTLEILLKHT